MQLRRDRSIRVYDQLTAGQFTTVQVVLAGRAFSVTNTGSLSIIMSDRYTYSGNGAVLGAALASNSYYGLVLRCKAVMRQNTIRVTSKKVNYAVCFMRNLS